MVSAVSAASGKMFSHSLNLLNPKWVKAPNTPRLTRGGLLPAHGLKHFSGPNDSQIDRLPCRCPVQDNSRFLLLNALVILVAPSSNVACMTPFGRPGCGFVARRSQRPESFVSNGSSDSCLSCLSYQWLTPFLDPPIQIHPNPPELH